MAEEKEFDGKKVARRLSTGPGVYLMKDAEGSVLYVGKAANLRKREGRVQNECRP